MGMRRGCARTPRDENGRPTNADIDALTARMGAYPGVREILVFGSGSRHELTARSDLDFAVLLEHHEWGRLGRRDPASGVRGIEVGRVLEKISRLLPPNRAIDLVADGHDVFAATERGIHGIAIRAGAAVWKNGRQIPWATAGANPARGARPQTASEDRMYAVSLREEAQNAAQAFGHARALHRQTRRPYTNHRVGAFANRAARHALRYALTIYAIEVDQGMGTAALFQRASAAMELKVKCGDKAVASLAEMKGWHFRGDPEPDARQAYEGLKTARELLLACCAVKKVPKVKRIEQPFWLRFRHGEPEALAESRRALQRHGTLTVRLRPNDGDESRPGRG